MVRLGASIEEKAVIKTTIDLVKIERADDWTDGHLATLSVVSGNTTAELTVVCPVGVEFDFIRPFAHVAAMQFFERGLAEAKSVIDKMPKVTDEES